MVGAVFFRRGSVSRRLATSVLLAGMLAPVIAQAGGTDCVQLAADRYGVPVSVIQAILFAAVPEFSLDFDMATT